MPWSRAFAEALKQAKGNLSHRELAKRAQISHTYAGHLLEGQVPSYQVVQQIADGLELDEGMRAALFEAAGYRGGAAPAEDGFRLADGGDVAYILDLEEFERSIRSHRGLRDLPENDIREVLAVMEAVIREKRRLRGLD